jgi:hypothetical protein
LFPIFANLAQNPTDATKRCSLPRFGTAPYDTGEKIGPVLLIPSNEEGISPQHISDTDHQLYQERSRMRFGERFDTPHDATDDAMERSALELRKIAFFEIGSGRIKRIISGDFDLAR